MTKKKVKKWIIYDGRYNYKPDRSEIAEVCNSLKEAKKSLREDWPEDYVIVEEELTEVDK